MEGTLFAFGTTCLWGAVHFLTAIPAGAKMGLPVPAAAAAAMAGYTAIGAAMLALGEGVRRWLVRRFRLSLTPNPEKLFWRAWLKWGMAGLGLLAPVTCGPWIAAIVGVALGEKPARILFWIAVGVVPYALALGILTAFGFSLARG